ncbi:MAG: hypothetical protein GX189_07750 [Clostridiales bacterium]|nr:hypothetical protein [Clostridiales bacterium]
MFGESSILSNLFSWKSKEQQKREEEEYARWAFPYGQEQRSRLVKLMLEIFPKETEPMVLIPFLTCKELYQNLCKKMGHEGAVRQLISEVKKYKRIIRKGEMPIYLALVVADSKVGEDLNYPPKEEILAMAKGFEVLHGQP